MSSSKGRIVVGFSNKTMRYIHGDRPHIVMIGGRWRVSPIGKGGWKNDKRRERWDKAHAWVQRENELLYGDELMALDKKWLESYEA